MVQIMAWRRPGDKPLSEPMTVVYWRIYASLGLNKLKTANAKFNEARFGPRTWHSQAQTTRDRRLCERSHQVGVAEVSMATKYLTRWSLGDFNGILHQWFLKQILVIDGWGTSCELALMWMSQEPTDDKSTLVHVMAWWRQATSHYLNQCWPRSLTPYGVTGQVLSLEWRCSWSSVGWRCSNCIWVINNFNAYEGASYIRGFTVPTLFRVTSLGVT